MCTCKNRCRYKGKRANFAEVLFTSSWHFFANVSLRLLNQNPRGIQVDEAAHLHNARPAPRIELEDRRQVPDLHGPVEGRGRDEPGHPVEDLR